MHAIAEKLLIWCYTIITLSLILPMEKGTRYNMIHFVNYLKQVGSFPPRRIPFPSPMNSTTIRNIFDSDVNHK